MTSLATDFSLEPAAGILHEHLVDGTGGRLRVAYAKPDGRGRATILTLAGRGELIEKYRPVAHEITHWGYGFFMLDWRGQGGSARLLPDPRKGHVADFRHYLADLATALTFLDTLDLPRRHLLLAHSMGGHIGLRALGEQRLAVAAAAFVAPMVDINLKGLPPWFARSTARAAVLTGQGARYAPGQRKAQARLIGFENNLLTTDPERFRQWRELLVRHPEYAIGGVTFGWLDAALRSIASVRRQAFLARIDVPCLVITAGNERIVDNHAAEQAAAWLPRGEHWRIEGALHDLFLAAEPERQQLMARLRAFFDRFS